MRRLSRRSRGMIPFRFRFVGPVGTEEGVRRERCKIGVDQCVTRESFVRVDGRRLDGEYDKGGGPASGKDRDGQSSGGRKFRRFFYCRKDPPEGTDGRWMSGQGPTLESLNPDLRSSRWVVHALG